MNGDATLLSSRGVMGDTRIKDTETSQNKVPNCKVKGTDFLTCNKVICDYLS